jgi:hypothetical protein
MRAVGRSLDILLSCGDYPAEIVLGIVRHPATALTTTSLFAEDHTNTALLDMLNARFDRVIRRPYTEMLWRAGGRPELIWLPTGHYTEALFSPYARHKVFTHVRRVFGGDQ